MGDVSGLRRWPRCWCSAPRPRPPRYKNTPTAALNGIAAPDTTPLAGHYSVKVLQTALREAGARNSLQYTTWRRAHCQRRDQTPSLAQPKPIEKKARVTSPPRRRGGSVPAKPTPDIVKQPRGPGVISRSAPRLFPASTAGQSCRRRAPSPSIAPRSWSSLPTPLLIVLAALLAAVVAVGGRALHQLVRARRSH